MDGSHILETNKMLLELTQKLIDSTNEDDAIEETERDGEGRIKRIIKKVNGKERTVREVEHDNEGNIIRVKHLKAVK